VPRAGDGEGIERTESRQGVGEASEKGSNRGAGPGVSRREMGAHMVAGLGDWKVEAKAEGGAKPEGG
jgi:hypothetical protein